MLLGENWCCSLLGPKGLTGSKENFYEQNWLQSFYNLNAQEKKFTCLLGKLKTEFTSPIAKSTGAGLSDMTFFARCFSPKLTLTLYIAVHFFNL